MPACASTSKRLVLILAALIALQASAADSGTRADQPEEDDFTQTPYTRYGEFGDDEDDDLAYLQYGRFFGVAVGLGYEGALGNKGMLYTGGFPAFELKVVYWFDFNLAMTLGVMNSSHTYSGQIRSRGDTAIKTYDLNLFRFGFELRYYFDVRDSAAALSFANPFVSGGVSSYNRTLTNANDESDRDKAGAFGYSAGLGTEFVLRPKKTYFNLEARVHQVNFPETKSAINVGDQEIPDQTGLLYTVTGAFLFTW